MRMTYTKLDADNIGGTSQADYLVGLDADFTVSEGSVQLYRELAFPVVELARSLFVWLSANSRGDFVFDSMSLEEVGAISLRRTSSGWLMESVFSPGVVSNPLDWADVERGCRDFLDQIEFDLLSMGLDPADVIHL
ncbi:DUF7878 domain-containing protein [Paenarthrobacter aurescens]|uniref:DUF7878 domain-containing protein n=1 Tax=Paenarthrobacter aurescens TaxID=43663 RepID=UPI0021C23A2B|nr:hypothetical protein [Paenarthrobacter aurescens]MCT9871968.1 hypothetical protein [Paenarthrobacter aurescens]